MISDHCKNQGDQIGRIVAFWAIVYFGEFLFISEVALEKVVN
jgi:hypothetical protein